MWGKARLRPAAVEVALAFTGLLVGYLVVGVLAMTIRATLESAIGGLAFGLVAGPLITVVGAVVYGYAGRTWDAAGAEEAEAPAKRSIPFTLLAIAAASLAAILGSVVIAIALDALGMPVQEQSSVVQIAESARAGEGLRDAILLTISALAIGPAAEEVLFRVLLFRRIARRSGLVLAYLLSGLAFAAIHANPAGFVIYAWLGTCFAATLDRTGRPGAAIAVHVINNAFVLSNLFFLAS
jgi:membrane protease YdiL (CAAX protease family)